MDFPAAPRVILSIEFGIYRAKPNITVIKSSYPSIVSSKADDCITFVVPNDRFNALSARAQSKGRDFKIIACKGEWAPATTRKPCARIQEFSDDLKAAMTAACAISPDEMCEAAKEVEALQKG